MKKRIVALAAASAIALGGTPAANAAELSIDETAVGSIAGPVIIGITLGCILSTGGHYHDKDGHYTSCLL